MLNYLDLQLGIFFFFNKKKEREMTNLTWSLQCMVPGHRFAAAVLHLPSSTTQTRHHRRH